VVTYSRLAPRGDPGPAERQEPFLDAREVPYRDDDLRAYDPDRAAGGDLDAVADGLAEPRRARGGGRRGGRGAVLIGTLALAAGMVILAYAYGVATRVDKSSPADASASAPAEAMRGTAPADDAARSVPVTGNAPAAAFAPAPEEPAAPAVGTTAALPPAGSPAAATAEPSQPQGQPDQAVGAPAAGPAASGSEGQPMDGDFALPAAGAQPALVAPVPATATPPATASAPAATEKPATARAEPPAAKAAAAKPADAKPADGSDDLMTNIERLLAHDTATTGAADQPAGGATAAAPMPLAPAPAAAPNDALPQLPDPNAVAAAPGAPPADVGPRLPGRLIPPADIPNVSPTDLGTGAGTSAQ
jgi:hypothetical protein